MKPFKLEIINAMEEMLKERHAVMLMDAALKVGIKNVKAEDAREIIYAFGKRHPEFTAFVLDAATPCSFFCSAFVVDGKSIPVGGTRELLQYMDRRAREANRIEINEFKGRCHVIYERKGDRWTECWRRVEIDGKMYTLSGWNGERWTECDKYRDHDLYMSDWPNIYEVAPIYSEELNEDGEHEIIDFVCTSVREKHIEIAPVCDDEPDDIVWYRDFMNDGAC